MSALVAVRYWPPPGMEQWLHNGTLRRPISPSLRSRVARALVCITSEQMPAPLGRFQLTGDACSGLVSALRLDDVDHPGHTELVGAHAEEVAPHLLLEWLGHGATLGELVPVAA